MDPFEILPEEICDDIFSHFNVKDIKQASLVSKRWYNIIGQSKICMEKLRINRVYRLDDFESILESNRQYQILTINIEPSKLKKNTKLLRIIREIVEKFSKSLVSIHISHDLKLKDDLPKLQTLEFINSFYNNLIVSNGLITKAKNLKKLNIQCHLLDKKSLQYIKAALMKNESLKVLEVRNSSLIQVLSHANLKLQLEEFYSNPSRRADASIIQEFFSTQASIQITQCQFIQDKIAYCMTNMPKLQTLIISQTYYYFEFDGNVKAEYPTNRTITKIAFKMAFYHADRIFVHAIAIIAKLLNLREITSYYLIPEILPYLYNCPSLKVVKYNSLSYSFTQAKKDEIAQHESIKFIKIPYGQI